MRFHPTAVLIGIVLAGALGITAQQRAKQADSPDTKEIRDYKLTMDTVEHYITAMKAIMADAAAQKCSGDNSGKAATLNDSEKTLSACAPAMVSIKAAGLKPREFLVLTGALMGDMMAVSMKKSGQIKEYPSTISAENAAFIEQNFDKLSAMMNGK